jgi:RimJ/RimL family protein N-acetyltransferase
MKWRNEQIYHLRQSKPLSKEDQDAYFENVVAKLFDQVQPNQILFSFLEDGVCIGYGGLVHINWIDRNAEISFIMDTSLEKDRFQEIWQSYLKLIEEVVYSDLSLHKIYTYAFDLRPHLYEALTNIGFFEDARLKEHSLFRGKAIDVLIHSKTNQNIQLVLANENDVEITYQWAADKNVRQFAFNKGEILFEEHKKWFTAKLLDPNCFYYILQRGAERVGSIRIDYSEESNIGLISYLIGSDFHGMGYGTEILHLIEELFLTKFETIHLKGLVMKSNYASVRIFNKLGYDLLLEQDDILTFSKTITR